MIAGSQPLPTEVDKTGDYTVLAADLLSNTTFRNTGAGAEVNLTLPAGADSYRFKCIVTAAQYLRCTADGTEKFNYGGDLSAAGGYIRANTVGRAWECEWNGTDWVLTHINGTVNYDE